MGQSRDGTSNLCDRNFILRHTQIICSKSATYPMEDIQEMGDTDPEWVGIFAFPESADYTPGFEV